MSKVEELSKSRGVDGTEALALWDILVQGLEAARKVYCVVDALDEMDEEDFDIVHRLMAVAGSDTRRVSKSSSPADPFRRLKRHLRGRECDS